MTEEDLVSKICKNLCRFLKNLAGFGHVLSYKIVSKRNKGMEWRMIEEIVSALLKKAILSRATDIHFFPRHDRIDIYFRITNRLVKKEQVSLQEAERMIAFLKYKAAMDIGEKRRPQNGSFSTTIAGKRYGFRLSTLPSQFAESLVIRIIPHDDYLPLERLSLFPGPLRIFKRLLTFSHGLLIFTGPTGSGKTTTLYALLHYSSIHLGRKVITLEDPVEKNHDSLLQIQVNEKAGITYSTGLKAILRHDPDLIMVGEIRDAETARIAVRAALTGHFVLTTMHTKDSMGALYRLLEFGVSYEEMAQTIIGISAQRLVQLMCPRCGEKYCSYNCSMRRLTAVYELLYGRELEKCIRTVKGEQMTPRYPRLKDILAKAVAYGFISKNEYEKWVHQLD